MTWEKRETPITNWLLARSCGVTQTQLIKRNATNWKEKRSRDRKVHKVQKFLFFAKIPLNTLINTSAYRILGLNLAFRKITIMRCFDHQLHQVQLVNCKKVIKL